MSFLSKLCGCQWSYGPSEGVEDVDTRIVEAKQPSPRTSISVPVYRAGQLRRPRRRTTSSTPFLGFDEKHLLQEEDTSCSSSQSSIVSIPSTRFTILTASRTGATASNRQSYDSNTLGPPPSYHSRRTTSPSPSDGVILEHPVMVPDWLQRLQNQAHADHDPFRDEPDLFDSALDVGDLL